MSIQWWMSMGLDRGLSATTWPAWARIGTPLKTCKVKCDMVAYMYEAISSYCKKRVGQESDHDRCYGPQKDWYLSCTCKCHAQQEEVKA